MKKLLLACLIMLVTSPVLAREVHWGDSMTGGEVQGLNESEYVPACVDCPYN
jgi:hypothetical protein